jgi:hypothetical protein
VSAALEERTEVVEDYRLDPGDAERFAHVVWAPGQKAEGVVTEARVYGTPVTALCGKRWIPARDPQRFPVCPECADKAALIKRMRGQS